MRLVGPPPPPPPPPPRTSPPARAPVAGEAAGLALGLLFAGSGSERSAEMFAYAHDTQHEKIIRGLAVGLALVQARWVAV